MNQLRSNGIILARINYGEADRILTMLTPDYGKLRLTARGVRKIKSRLAGGIELFSVSEITFIRGKGDLDTLVSTRLVKHYESIVKDLNRTMQAYELMKKLNRETEDETEPEYFTLLSRAFEALNDSRISTELINLWFDAQLLRLAGLSPNLVSDNMGKKLDSRQAYNFSFDDMAFVGNENGRFGANHIKILRLLFGDFLPKTLQQITSVEKLLRDISPLILAMLRSYLSR